MDQKQGPPVHACPVKSDLHGVDAGSVVISESRQHVQLLEMAASRKYLKFWGQRLMTHNQVTYTDSIYSYRPLDICVRF